MVIESSRTAVAITTAERCDRCGARAFVRTTFAAGDQLQDLLWCGHHFAAHEMRIREQAVLIQDERDAIDDPVPPLD